MELTTPIRMVPAADARRMNGAATDPSRTPDAPIPKPRRVMVMWFCLPDARADGGLIFLKHKPGFSHGVKLFRQQPPSSIPDFASRNLGRLHPAVQGDDTGSAQPEIVLERVRDVRHLTA